MQRSPGTYSTTRCGVPSSAFLLKCQSSKYMVHCGGAIASNRSIRVLSPISFARSWMSKLVAKNHVRMNGCLANSRVRGVNGDDLIRSLVSTNQIGISPFQPLQNISLRGYRRLERGHVLWRSSENLDVRERALDLPVDKRRRACVTMMGRCEECSRSAHGQDSKEVSTRRHGIGFRQFFATKVHPEVE